LSMYVIPAKAGIHNKEPADVQYLSLRVITWAINSFLPGQVAYRYRKSNIVVFSTGNVYPFVRTGKREPREDTEPNPVGEYAQSCLGRERVFQYL
jgi:hypothetical protein